MLSLVICDILLHPFRGANNTEIITLIILLAGLLGSFVVWAIHKWKSKYPYILDVFEKNYYEIKPDDKSELKTIKIRPGLCPFITLRIKPRKGTTLEEINVRFVEKCRYRFINASSSILYIKELIDPKVKSESDMSGRIFSVKADGAGGYDGWYKPPLNCPKGGFIWLRIDTDIKKEWKGYISFQHRVGDTERTYARKKIIFEEIALPR